MDSWSKVEVTSLFSIPLCVRDYDVDVEELEKECVRRSTLDPGRIISNSGGWQSNNIFADDYFFSCLLYTSPSPRDATLSRMPSSA